MTWRATVKLRSNCDECSSKRDANSIVFAPSSEQGMNTPGISSQAVSICPTDKKKNGKSLGLAEADGGLGRAVAIYLETIAVTASVWRADGLSYLYFRKTLTIRCPRITQTPNDDLDGNIEASNCRICISENIDNPDAHALLKTQMMTWRATVKLRSNCDECSPKRDLNSIVFAPFSEQGMNTPGISSQAVSICPADKRRMGGR
ncbi:hypothetical protein CEXT_759681 [Caerostris extrusa]|uniref:Uncharacterized protein n=1 Tax=Caerostris extrusa TaxID=172846 RepID=A0AAV4N1M3_CAEEX|nr:hypothetical protein CEXT_759681 [Caerostris extrusa]